MITTHSSNDERPELKPCPFCGSSKIESFLDVNGGDTSNMCGVRCMECEAMMASFIGSLEFFPDSESIDSIMHNNVAAWNRRVK